MIRTLTSDLLYLLAHGAPAQNPNLIVVHCMAAEVEHEGTRVPAWVLLDRLGLSAHVLIHPDGYRVRCRMDTQGAFHAKGFNTNSLGVEVLVPGVYTLEQLQARTRTPYVTPAQMEVLVQQVLEWKRRYPITRIARHSDLDPQRRWFDPGAGFPWEELLRRTWAAK